MPRRESYTIGQLAQIADVTTRTIRYYVAEELLPAPEGAGRAASYNDEHLARLKLIKILKDEYLPLQEIRALLSGLDNQAVVELLEEKQKKSEHFLQPASASAKEYLQSLLHPSDEPAGTPSLMRHRVKSHKRHKKDASSQNIKEETQYKTDNDILSSPQMPDPRLTTRPSPFLPEEEPEELGDNQAEIRDKGMGASRALAIGATPTASTPLESDTSQTLSRWQRIQITPDVELHIKEGLENTSLWQKIEHLVKIARQILGSII